MAVSKELMTTTLSIEVESGVDNKGNINNILSLTELTRQILNLPYMHITSISELNSAV